MIARFGFILIVGVLALGVPSAALEVYVSPKGDDGNPGTQAEPVKTLEAARDAVRAGKGDAGATVWLEEGRHFRTSTFELDERDSGSEDSPVVYKGREGAEVFVDGGVLIPSDACEPVKSTKVRKRLLPEASGEILQIDLKECGITDYGTLGPRGFRRAYIPAPLELFIDGKAQTIARWPNEGEKHIPMGRVIDRGSNPREGDYSYKPGTFEYDTPRAERWVQAKDLYISGIFNYGYADDTIQVARIDTEKGTFTTTHPHLYGFEKRSFTSWYALNLLEEIDLPGEYYVDTGTGMLYFYPPGPMEGAQIQVSMMKEPMVAIEGASHVRFENITFENTRGTGFYIEGGASNLIDGCTLRNMGIVAVQIGKGVKPFPYGKHDGCGYQESGEPGEPASRALGSWHEHIYRYTAWNRDGGTGNGVQDCDIYDIGAGGVSLGGGDRKTLTPAGNFVRGCDIHHVNRWDRTYKAPINIDGVGNEIVNNHIHDSPGMGIYLHGNDHVIAFNEIDHVVKDMSDQAAIYMGRDPSESGTVIRHNFFHDLYNFHEGGHGVQAIFFDDCCVFGATVTGNIFYRTGNTGVIKFNGGGASPIVNNVFIDCPQPVQGAGDNTKRVRDFMQGEMGQERLREAVDITTDPYATKYPIVKAIYTGESPVETPFLRNYVGKSDESPFVNPSELDFRLKEGAKIDEDVPGFEPIPFEQIGLHR
jgi:hypothetical protein